MPSNAAFHPTIETVGFQTAFSVKERDLSFITKDFSSSDSSYDSYSEIILEINQVEMPTRTSSKNSASNKINAI
jgi:hypothetical protein